MSKRGRRTEENRETWPGEDKRVNKIRGRGPQETNAAVTGDSRQSVHAAARSRPITVRKRMKTRGEGAAGTFSRCEAAAAALNAAQPCN